MSGVKEHFSAEISQRNPTCFLFLVDQSGSMSKPFGGDSGKIKAHGVADAINRLVHSLVFRCSRGDEIVNRYFIGILGYNDRVTSAYGGALTNQYLVPVGQVGTNPLRVETRTRLIDDGTGGLVKQTVKFPVWIDPVFEGKTRMCEALTMASGMVTDFISQYPDCFPPIVINITDGEATDGPAEEVEATAQVLRNVASTDGNVLLFNVHISSDNSPQVEYPSHESQLSNHFARLLFRMSSKLPPTMLRQAVSAEVKVAPDARGFVFNGDLVSVVKFLDIGTRIDRNMR